MVLDMIKAIIICIIAGAGAGIGTGFAGLSAACFISPMLAAFLNVPIYEAVGIALSSDILASAVSAYTYHRAGNIDVKKGRILLYCVILFTIVGSVIAYFFASTDSGNTALSYISIVATLMLGVKFIRNPNNPEHGEKAEKLQGKIWVSVLAGAIIGLICGFQGAGGGMMMLFALVAVLMFDMKKAVGTSVFIMTFTAFIGAAAHFIINGQPNYLYLIICVISTFIFARISAVWANRLSTRASYLIVGYLLAVSGVAMLITKIWL